MPHSITGINTKNNWPDRLDKRGHENDFYLSGKRTQRE